MLQKFLYCLWINILLVSACVGMMGDRMPVMAMPVNHLLTSKKAVDMVVKIPDNFKKLSESMSSAGKLEFILRSDANPKQWSELITAHMFIGKKCTAAKLLQEIRSIFVDKYKGVVLDATAQPGDSYNSRKLALVYTVNNRRELLFAHYASGPCDCSGVQYSIALNTQMDEAKALAKAEEFMKNNVHIISHVCDSSEALDQK